MMAKTLFREKYRAIISNSAFFVFLTFFIGNAIAAEDDFAGGNGTQGKPYLIETAKHLDNVRNHLNAHFKQTTDVDLNGFSEGAGWAPIARGNAVLEGTFDGNGYEISGLTINRPRTDGVGLFKGLGRKSTVKNMTLKNIDIKGNNVTGGLAGGGAGNIENVSVKGDVAAGALAGGLVGISSGDIYIKDSSFQGEVKGLEYVGGLLGSSAFPMGSMAADVPDRHPSIKTCSAQGRVVGKEITGGLLGANAGDIKQCWFSGLVEGEQTTGGLIGKNEDGSVTESCSGGQVLGKENTGGLVGDNESVIVNSYARTCVKAEVKTGALIGTNKGNVDNSYAASLIDGEENPLRLIAHNTGDISNSYYLKGTNGRTDADKEFVRTAKEMRQRKTFEGWNFQDIWTMEAKDKFPRLRWQTVREDAVPEMQAKKMKKHTGAGKRPDITGEFAGGSGTQDNPYLVGSADQLDNVRDHLDKHFRQVADIDLADFSSGKGWEPIGYFGFRNSFTGTFDGNGYEIINLTIDRPKTFVHRGLQSERNRLGLFGIISGDGLVKNVSVKNMAIVGIHLIGGIAGGVYDKGEVRNCCTSGKIKGWGLEAGKMGCLVGSNSGTISESFASVEVSGRFSQGGFVGVNHKNGIIENSYCHGRFKREEIMKAGGFAGVNRGDIIHCYAVMEFDVGEVSEENGLSGFVVVSEKQFDEKDEEPKIEACYYDKDVAGLNDTQGDSIPKTTEEMMQRETFEDWDFQETWAIDEGESYPYLRWEQNKQSD